MSAESQIIVSPILTEKMSHLEESQNKYAFRVSRDANKISIKRAVEKKFNVKDSAVRTQIIKGKRKEMTVRSGGHTIRTRGKRSDWKKAIITLHEGFSIDLYGMGAES